nr:hypothetical protein [uncultured bacterium]
MARLPIVERHREFLDAMKASSLQAHDQRTLEKALGWQQPPLEVVNG